MASGDTLMVCVPQCNQPPAANYATFDTRNDHLILDFDPDADESAIFPGVMPASYAGGGLTVTLVWLASSATSGEARWDVAFERHQDDTTDLDSDSFAGVQSVTATAPSASGEPKYSGISFTDGAQIDSIAVSESFRMKVTRDADHADDDMAGDAELLRIIIKET